jgi:phosphate butyryltransferase
MLLPDFDALHRDADATAEPVAVAVAGGADGTVLEALRIARDRGWVAPLLVGPSAEVRAVAVEAGVGLDGLALVDADGPSTADAAVALVREGRAKMLMKGRISTPDLLRAVLDPETGLRTGRLIGQAVLMEIRRDARRFLLADTGIRVRPTRAQKGQILRAVVEVAHALGVPEPRVALVAASERAVEAMPETLDAAELQRRAEAGEFPGCIVQGPLSFDLAYAADAGEAKRLGGPVIGAADAMVFPDLASANLTVKAIMYTADCRFGGLLYGTSGPVVFMSRADATATRLNSLALALRVGAHEARDPTVRASERISTPTPRDIRLP